MSFGKIQNFLFQLGSEYKGNLAGNQSQLGTGAQSTGFCEKVCILQNKLLFNLNRTPMRSGLNFFLNEVVYEIFSFLHVNFDFKVFLRENKRCSIGKTRKKL